MSGPHHIVGLSLFGPLVLTVATAPADRVRLLLQTQDEIVLNLREESLAHHHYHSSSSSPSPSVPGHASCTSSSKTIPYSVNSSDDTTQDATTATNSDKNASEEEEESDEEEPRSIIAPYAQLPYTDMQDCYHRLLEKEGPKALWRGYSAEIGRIFLQKSVEMRLNRRGAFALRRWMSLAPPTSSQGSATKWLLATAFEGTLIGAAAMAVVYPLSVMHAKMATDVVRKTRTVRRVAVSKKTDSSSTSTSIVATEEEKDKGEEETGERVESSTGSISRRDSVEWVDHTAEWAIHTTEEHKIQDQDQDQDTTVSSLHVTDSKDITTADNSTAMTTLTTTVAAECDQDHNEFTTTVSYELSHKYKTYRQIYQETLASPEGYLGFYKGFSTVVTSAFISRLGLMTVYTVKSLCSSSGAVTFSPFQVFVTQTLLSVMTYPLNVVGNRRMIARPGRYSSSWDAAQQIVERQGWQALFKGVEVVVLRSVVLAALSQLLL
ncbi:hypothetical protein EC991_003003 [Linnemannia zychae]|nr:hypothetical protein EC991_003003 [Linnemannia zychae]